MLQISRSATFNKILPVAASEKTKTLSEEWLSAQLLGLQTLCDQSRTFSKTVTDYEILTTGALNPL